MIKIIELLMQKLPEHVRAYFRWRIYGRLVILIAVLIAWPFLNRIEIKLGKRKTYYPNTKNLWVVRDLDKDTAKAYYQNGSLNIDENSEMKIVYYLNGTIHSIVDKKNHFSKYYSRDGKLSNVDFYNNSGYNKKIKSKKIYYKNGRLKTEFKMIDNNIRIQKSYRKDGTKERESIRDSRTGSWVNDKLYDSFGNLERDIWNPKYKHLMKKFSE